MAKITLGALDFAKQDDAKAYLRDKIAAYVIGAPIPDTDVALWFAVLQKHEWFDEYVTHGINHFTAAWSEQRPNLRNMVVVNDRGERKPFSYHKYLTRGPLSKMAKVLAALRTEIEPQITNHRIKGFHVHHAGKPFVQIADEFLLANAHRWSTIETESAGATGYRLRDRSVAAEWFDFHRAHAKFEVVSPSENMQIGASGYRMRFREPVSIPPPPF